MEKTYQRIIKRLLLCLLPAYCLAAAQAQALSLISDEETEIVLRRTLQPSIKAADTEYNPRRIKIVNDKS